MAGLSDIFQQISEKSGMTHANMTGLMLALNKLSQAEPAQQPQQSLPQPAPAKQAAPQPISYRRVSQQDWHPQLPSWQPQFKQQAYQAPASNLSQMFLINDLEHGLPMGMTETIATIETGHIKDPTKRARVISPAGAVGMMQFMPDTGRQYGLDAAGLRDPARAVPAAGRHLRDLLDQFKDPILAAAAYNAGSGAVNKYRGVPPYRETQNYVSKARRLMRSLYRG